MQMLGLCIFINFFFLSSHGLQPFKVYNLQKLKQNTNKNISLTTSESQILINSSILPVAAIVHPPLFLPVGTSTSHSLLYWGYVDRASSHCRTGGEIWLYRVSIWNDSIMDRDLDTCNKSDTHTGIRCAVTSKTRPPHWVQGQDRRLVIFCNAVSLLFSW